MTTTYYISWETKKSNRARAWYASKEVTTEAEARAMYDNRIQNPKTQTAYLWRKETYKPNEVHNWGFPYDPINYKTLSYYSK